MTFYTSVLAADAANDARTALLDAGGAGSIKFYTVGGGIPTSTEAAVDGGSVLLGTCTLSGTAFGASSSGTATAAAITDDTSADATGTAAFYRALSGAGTCIFQGTVTATGGGGDMEINTVSITAGANIEITSWTLTQPTSS